MARGPLPGVDVTIADGGLGLLPPATAQLHAKLGPATAGELNTIVTVNSIQSAVAAFGSGPLVEACAAALSISGTPIYAMRTEAAVGTVSAVTQDGTGVGEIGVTGSPIDAYVIVITIVRSGEPGPGVNQAEFQYSLDGGVTASPPVRMPTAPYVIAGTGLSLAFDVTGSTPPPASFLAGDTYSATTTAPAATLVQLQAAMEVLLADRRQWGWVHVLGESTPIIGAAMAARMAEAEGKHRYCFCVLDARRPGPAETHAAWMASVIAEWGTFADVRVGVNAGLALIVSPLTGLALYRAGSWSYVGRLAKIPVHEHPGRVASNSVPGIAELQHDEFATGGLDPERLTTFRTFYGLDGYWVSRGRIKAPQTSDFQFVENRRVMDLACHIARIAALRFVNDHLRVHPSTGFIYEPDARKIEAYVQGALYAGILAPGHASHTSVVLSRTTNVLASRWVELTVRIIPLLYTEYLSIDIGFENPFLTAIGARATGTLAATGAPRTARAYAAT